jgi:hypothetical protein
VLSGDCVASLAVIAGIQQRNVEPSLVWFDAHGDFHTEDTTTSGYLGGLPLAKAVGRGDPTLPAGLGLTPLPEPSILLVDGRDLDPPPRGRRHHRQRGPSRTYTTSRPAVRSGRSDAIQARCASHGLQGHNRGARGDGCPAEQSNRTPARRSLGEHDPDEHSAERRGPAQCSEYGQPSAAARARM